MIELDWLPPRRKGGKAVLQWLLGMSPTPPVVLHATGASWDEFLMLGAGVAVSTAVFFMVGRGGKGKGKGKDS